MSCPHGFDTGACIECPLSEYTLPVTTAPDPVNHPKHYNFSKIEVIDALEAWDLDFRLANVIKYVVRSGHKGNEMQDMRKALWYLQRYISDLEQK